MTKDRVAGRLGLAVGVVTVAVSLVADNHRAAARENTRVRQQVTDAYSKLPLCFEANEGQSDPQVRFLSRGSGYALFLTDREAILSLRGSKKDAAPAVLRMGLDGARPAAKVTGLEQLEGKTNYLRGRDRTKWHTDIANYGRVRYDSVYPGVDVVYYGNQRQLEYDFLVAPGSSPDPIRLTFAGAKRVELAKNGDLLLHAGQGTVRQQRPVIYQQVGGKRREVQGSYVLLNPKRKTDGAAVVGFKIAKYDATKPLVIDPILTYSTYLGGVFDDQALAVCADKFGCAYVAGHTESPKIPFGGAIRGDIQGEDGFICKLNSAGCALVWSTYLGAEGDDCIFGLGLDADRNVYVTGRTNSLEFPVTPGAFLQAYGGGNGDGFVTKINPPGDEIIYSTYLGGTALDDGRGIDVDVDGNAYVTGYTGSTDFPVTPGAFQEVFGNGNPDGGGNSDAYVFKLNPDGSLPVYSTYLGGGPTVKSIGDDWGNAIRVDAQGSAYVTGATNALDFPKKLALQSRIEKTDAFVTKFLPDGDDIEFSTYLGGAKYDEGFGIALDPSRGIYVVGTTSSPQFGAAPDFGQLPLFLSKYKGGDSDAFVTRLNSKASRMSYFRYVGGGKADFGKGIVVDSGLNCWVTGTINVPNARVNNTDPPPSDSDAFVLKLDPTGAKDLFQTLLKGSKDDHGCAICKDPYNGIYVVGDTLSTNFSKGTITPFQVNAIGRKEGFAVKIPSKPAGKLSVSPKRLKYTSFVGGPVTKTVTMRNSGKMPVAVTLGPLTPPFRVLLNETEFIIEPGQTILVPISFAAKTTAGVYVQDLVVTTTATGKKACTKVHLTGVAR
jgi:hypothetical protein